MKAMHAGWALCKGCGELMTQAESDEEKGWCGLCVYLCYDCMHEEKYGPETPLDFSSVRSVPEDTDPELEDPGPPPKSDWLSPILSKGTSDREKG
jgi:hypothetical protein